MTEVVAIGTQVLPDHDAAAGSGVPQQSAEAAAIVVPAEEGTLLAVVPLPGTGTSLAIVGYPVSTAAFGDRAADRTDRAADRTDRAADRTDRADRAADRTGRTTDRTGRTGRTAAHAAAPGNRGDRGDRAADRSEPVAGLAVSGERAFHLETPGAGIRLDHTQRRLWVDGTEITLTFQEFELLAFLAARPATIFSRTELLERVWQRDLGYTSRTVDVHVSRLRNKLGPVHGRCLATEYRVGYQFRPL